MVGEASPEHWSLPDPWFLAYRPITGSTNDDAKVAARAGRPPYGVYLSDFQTGGHGRFGRNWVAPEGACLLFSLLLADVVDPVRCTAAASVATAEAIAETTGLAARIKWPNDVMIGERKVCGILAEVVTTTFGVASVVGVGLNVNLDLGVEGLPPTATSLAHEVGHPLPRAPLLRAILTRVNLWLGQAAGSDGSGGQPVMAGSAVLQRWEALLWRQSQSVLLSDDGSVIEGVVEGLAPSGGLRLRLADGRVREVITGELVIDRP